MPILRSLRVMLKFEWPTEAVTRLWEGSGPMADTEGNIWYGCALGEEIGAIEQAINGEAYTLGLTLTNVSQDNSNLAWLGYTNDQILGAKVQILVQPCDEKDQPIGAPDVMFTGIIDNISFDDFVENKRIRSIIVVEVTNRFQLRRVVDGSVLSDADQKARAYAMNPSEPLDKFCERIPLLEDKTVDWPRWK